MSNYNPFSQIYRYVKGWYHKYDGTEYTKWIKRFIVYDYTGIYSESTSDQEYFGLLRRAVIEHFKLYPIGRGCRTNITCY